MIRQNSLVFRKIDYCMIFVLLILKRHSTLAKYFVNLDPDNPLSDEQIVGLIKRRVKKFDPDQLAALKPGA